METCEHCRPTQEDQSRRTFLKRALGVAGATLVLNFFPASFSGAPRLLQSTQGRRWWLCFSEEVTTA